ncbi:MAG: hypothetical protein IPK19_00015 [Chloroflexi bacterium]|nr:hypothetical protein [Chloroflexota bacterium]
MPEYPTSGFLLRNARGVTVRNCEVVWGSTVTLPTVTPWKPSTSPIWSWKPSEASPSIRSATRGYGSTASIRTESRESSARW